MSTMTPSDPLPEDPVILQALVRRQRAQIAELEQRLAWFLVQYRLAQHRRFAASTETSVHQLDLFAELLADALPTEEAGPVATVLPGTAGAEVGSPRVRGHGGRRPLPRSLPRETIVHDLADD
ncbi:MAG TPA: transposase [Candidatus Competibacteraceae bacterium]|nr:transposase [Candidatus Competibacteraceae bacterium]